MLPAECLGKILEILEDDNATLYSCLLVNRLLCKTSVRTLWKNVWNFEHSAPRDHKLRVASGILSTLVACLPNESRTLLRKNKIYISRPTSKKPLFNYAAFCKVLSIYELS